MAKSRKKNIRGRLTGAKVESNDDGRIFPEPFRRRFLSVLELLLLTCLKYWSASPVQRRDFSEPEAGVARPLDVKVPTSSVEALCPKRRRRGLYFANPETLPVIYPRI